MNLHVPSGCDDCVPTFAPVIYSIDTSLKEEVIA